MKYVISQDEMLRQIVEGMTTGRNWKSISEMMPNRSDKDCKRRWYHLARKSDGKSRIPWSKEVR
jgi:hypothetical protein